MAPDPSAPTEVTLRRGFAPGDSAGECSDPHTHRIAYDLHIVGRKGRIG